MTIIENKEKEQIEIDCSEKIDFSFVEFQKCLNGNYIITSQARKRISLFFNSELIVNLTIGEFYNVTLNQYFSIIGENKVDLIYEVGSNIIIKYNKTRDIIVKGQTESKNKAFIKEQSVIKGDGNFIIFFKPVIPCVLMSIENISNRMTLIFEEIKQY